jgi:DNA-binding NtrC family response regulator
MIDRIMRWQKARKEVVVLRQAMGVYEAPYVEATRLFRKEYCKKALERAGGDEKKAAEVAGIEQAEFERILKDS